MNIFHFRTKKRTSRLKRMIVSAAIGAVVIVVVLAGSLIVPGATAKRAQAGSADAYPASCLGGWQGPANAEGAPDAGEGAAAVFTDSNSAVLNQADAQIFCGSFQASDQSESPTAVTLHFSWNVIFPGEATTTPSAGTVATGTDGAAWADVLDSTSTATTTNANSGAAATSTPIPIPTPTPTPTPQASSSDASSSPPAAPAPAPTAPAPSSSPDATSSGTSLLDFFAPRAFAQTADATTSLAADASDGNFLDVSYSLDGVTWQDLGDVNVANWQNFSAAIPIGSWSDVNAIQVRLTPILSADPPTIWLDGMWLEVDGGTTLGGIIEQGASTTLGVLGDIGNAITSAISDILPGDNATGTASTDLTDASTTPPTTPDVPQPTPAPAAPAHRYSFQARNGTSMNSKDLSWVPADQLKNYNASATRVAAAAAPTVTVVANNTIRVAGTCSEAYYTILIFANPDDYKDDPAAALYNKAFPCAGGSFTQTIADSELPPQLPAGTYYLLVANQGKTGPWQPYPELFPVVIGADNS